MQSLIQFSDFVTEITASTKNTYKKEVLAKYKDNEIIKYYLNYIYNPYILTGISNKKLAKMQNLMVSKDTNDFNGIIDLLDYVKENPNGAYSVLSRVYNYIVDYLGPTRANLIELLYKVLTKNLQIGVDVKTINKAMGNFIPEFSVQLANKYFDKPSVVDNMTFAITSKIDGGRIIALKKDGEITFYTRQGQKYEGLVDLEEEMKKLPDNICLDGEITTLDNHPLHNTTPSKELYKQAMKITRADGIKHGVKMLVFDCMTADEFLSRSCNEIYAFRRANLVCWMEKPFLEEAIKFGNKLPIPHTTEEHLKWMTAQEQFINSKYTYFEILPILYQGNDTNKITELLKLHIDKGEEGVMINDVNAVYKFSRTNSLLKVKKMNDIDLEIIDTYEGENDLQGTLGGFVVMYKGNPVKVGSGLSRDLRDTVWSHREDYVGITISIQYFEETENAKGTKSLRFPVFLDFRYDK